MSNTEWPAVTMSPSKTPEQHLDPLIAIFQDLRRHAALNDAMEHLAAAIRGVEAHARPGVSRFATDFPARSAS